MDLSKRMYEIASFASDINSIADIGTDHGYIPIYLCKNGFAEKAIACDINKGPLERAKNNIADNCLSDKIETRLGNGLAPIKPFEVDGIVIAGMGGLLMCEILRASAETVASLKTLVLQPQTEIESVRRYIHSIGFCIATEKMVFDGEKYYTVIKATRGEEKYATLAEYVFGKKNIENKQKEFFDYLNFELKKNMSVVEKIQNVQSEKSKERLKEIDEDIKLIQEVLQCL